MGQGKIHLYWGDGKGKTTAAMGLALRALGAGRQVCILQFLKGAESGEIPLLRQLGAVVMRDEPGLKFVFQMNETEKQACRAAQNARLLAARAGQARLLILDEACGALETGMLDEALLRAAVLEKPAEQELVLTGRNPPAWLRDAADYSTEMCCRRHPYTDGTPARRGIEY